LVQETVGLPLHGFDRVMGFLQGAGGEGIIIICRDALAGPGIAWVAARLPAVWLPGGWKRRPQVNPFVKKSAYSE